VPRPEEAVELHFRRIEDCLDRRKDRDVVAEQGEVAQPRLARLQHRECRCRHGGLEAQREEDDFSTRVFPGELQRIEGRVDHAYVGAGGLRLKQARA
jgi:hypothetical protein